MIFKAPFLASIPLITLIAAAGAATPAVKNPDTYVYATVAEVNSLDPAWDGDAASQEIILNLYDTLFVFDGTSTTKVLPLIAETVPSRENGGISEDGKTYIIPIRKGVKFHNGTPLTPEDVRYSMMRFMIMDAGPAMMLLDPLAGYTTSHDPAGKLRPTVFKDADRAVRIENENIVLRLPRPFPPLLPILARWSPIISKKWAVAHGDWDGTEAAWTKFNGPKKEDSPLLDHENASGPFVLDRWDRAGHEMVLKRNDSYWRGPAKIRQVIVKSISEFSTRRLLLQAGDADAIDADRTAYSQLENLPGIQIIDDLPIMQVRPAVEFCFHSEPKGNPYIGSGRLDGEGIPPDFFADQDIRKGFAYAFDYSGYIRDVLRGKATRSTGFIPKGMFAYNPQQKTYSFDLDKAKEHFRRAWNGKVWEQGFHFALLYSNGSSYREVAAQMVKRNVESLNSKFKIDLQGLDWPTLMDASDKHKIPLVVMGRYAPYPDPHALAFQFMLSDALNPCHYKSSASDALVHSALVELDPGKRAGLYHQLLELEYEDVPFISVSDVVDYRVQRSWVKGWFYNPMIPVGGYFYSLYKENP